MSILSRIFSSQFGKCLRQATEDARTDRAAHRAIRIMEIHKVPEGEKRQFGDFTLMLGNSSNPNDTNLSVEIDYRGKRVLNYSSFGDDFCHVVARREMSPDLSWTAALEIEFKNALKFERAQNNQQRYLAA